MRHYWIGLTDFAKEGEWNWTSSEPITYTNWALHEPMDADRGNEDYVLMRGGGAGKWFDVGPSSIEWQSTRMAIIEKDNPPRQNAREEVTQCEFNIRMQRPYGG